MVYTWGEGLYGQLGHGIEVDHLFEPTILSKLVGKEIVNVFCGMNHTMFLSKTGLVYACGNGYYGQLGLQLEIDYVLYFYSIFIHSFHLHLFKHFQTIQLFKLHVVKHSLSFLLKRIICY